MAIQKIKWIKGQNKEEWLRQRADLMGQGHYDFVRFGSSEIATIADMSKWESPRKLYYNKLGLYLTPKHSYKLTMGSRMEPIIADSYESWMGDREQFDIDFTNGVKHRKLRQAKFFMLNDDYPFHISSIDYIQPARYPDIYTGELIKGGIIVENKNPAYMAYKNWGGKIPNYYNAQIQQQLLVSGMKKAVLACIAGSDYFDCFEVLPDIELQKYIDFRVTEFGLNVLKAKTILQLIHTEELATAPETSYIEDLWGMIHQLEPEVDDSEASKDFLEDEQYPESDNTLVYQGDEKHLTLIKRYLKSVALEGKLKDNKTYIRNLLTDDMQDFETLTVEGHKVTNRRGDGKRPYFSIK